MYSFFDDSRINLDKMSITTSELAQKIDGKFCTLQRYISQLQSLGVLTREGGRKVGYWVIIKDR